MHFLILNVGEMNVKFTLRDATVLELWFYHLYGVVLQVEVDLTPPHPVLLLLLLGHCFLKVGIEAKHLQRRGTRDGERSSTVEHSSQPQFISIDTGKMESEIGSLRHHRHTVSFLFHFADIPK